MEMKMKQKYKLKEVNNGVAIIQVEGNITEKAESNRVCER